MTDALTSVQMRIAEIRQQFYAPAPARVQSAGSTDKLSFAAALEQATSTAAVSGALGSDGIPTELKKYGNGKAPDSALSPIGVGDHKLWAPAAQSLSSLRGEAARAGVTIGVNDSYRSYEEQVAMAKSKGIYGQGGLAAVPGRSNHGWGISVDLELDNNAQTWMKANAGRFGYVNDVAGEPWHWTYSG